MSPVPRHWQSTARPTALVGLAACIIGIIAQIWSHRADMVHAFWDAQAHLDIARRVFDSTTPGLQMLGTVWLPIPHLLYLPFTLVDEWWWNGLAGGIVGFVAYLMTVVAVFDIVRRRTGAVSWGWVGATLVLFNPSLLYLQTTAMTEPLLLGFMTASVALLNRWWDEPAGRPRTLQVAGILAALAVGSRYDGWFYLAVAAPMVLWRSHSPRAVLRFALPSALFLAAWLGYNWHYFGDALEFQRGAWSAAAQQRSLAQQGLLPTAGKPLLALWYYLGAVLLTTGAVVTVAGFIGALADRGRSGLAALGLLSSALLFNLIALVAAQSVIALPWTDPAGVLNVRYGVMMLPAAAVGTAYGLRAFRLNGRGMLLALLLVTGVQGALWWRNAPTQVGALREGLAIRDGDVAQMNASRWLEYNYDRGRILVTPAVNVSPRTRIRMRDRVYPWSWQLGDAALANPGATVDWIIVDRRNEDDVVTKAVAADTLFDRHFRLGFEERGLEIWRRR
jgi:4-amino-4-deoxy-L-arabinose transferase-like glycosyltransferase